MSNLRIGTSGWSYPSGKGTWNGIFYQPRRGRGSKRGEGAPAPKCDELSFYAEHFDTVEINTTFYGRPKAAVAATWADRTPPGFEFSLKLYRKLTHERAPQLDEAEVDAFRRGIEPLAGAGKIGALLAQLPASFKHSPESQAYLDSLLARFYDYPVAVELRHRSWSDHFGATLGLLNSHSATLAQIDEPKFQTFIRQNQLPNVTGFYYMRLHGRNAAQWWKPDAPEERYNYLYTADKLRPISETAEAAHRLVKKFYLYFNNHFAAKGVVNAVMLKHQLGEPITGQYTKALADAYPQLAGIVTHYTEAWAPAPMRLEHR